MQIVHVIYHISSIGPKQDIRVTAQIKSGTNRKLVYDFLLVAIVTFAVSHSVLEKFNFTDVYAKFNYDRLHIDKVLEN